MHRVFLGRAALLAAILLVADSQAAELNLMDEIVISVQKREQTTRDVPLSVSAFDSEFLRGLNTRDFRDLVNLTPGFNGATADSFSDALAIRGVSSNSFGVAYVASQSCFQRTIACLRFVVSHCVFKFIIQADTHCNSASICPIFSP